MASPRDTYIAGVYAPHVAINAAHRVMIVDKNDKLGTITPTLNGQLLIGAAAASAQWHQLTPGYNVTITNVGNTITLSAGAGAGGTTMFHTGAGDASEDPADSSITLVGATGPLYTHGTSHTINIGMSNGTNGFLLIGGGGNPIWNRVTSTGGSMTVTLGANTLNLEASGDVGGAKSFHAGSGTATPVSGAISVVGGLNINTTGSGSTITIQTNNSINLPTTTSDSTGAYKINNIRMMHGYGQYNAFVGSTAGNYSTTATANTAVGNNSTNSLTSGADNTALGDGSLTALTTGTANTAVGYTASNTLALTSNSTSLGYNALTAGANAVAIGVNAGSGFTAPNNGNIIIGASGASGTTNTTRIGTTGVSNGQVGACYMGGIVPVGYVGSTLTTIDGNDKLGIIAGRVPNTAQVIMYDPSNNVTAGNLISTNNSIIVSSTDAGLNLVRKNITWYAYQNSTTGYTLDDSIYLVGSQNETFTRLFDTNSVITGGDGSGPIKVTIPLTGFYYIQLTACVFPSQDYYYSPAYAAQVAKLQALIAALRAGGNPNYPYASPLYIYVNGVAKWITYDRDLEQSGFNGRSAMYAISSLFTAGDVLTFAVQLTSVPPITPHIKFFIVGADITNAYTATSICGYLISPP